MNIDYSKITDNPKVVELLKQRTEIENKIKAIDETALIMHELELLSLPDVVDTLVCDIVKGTRCKDSFANYRDGVCYVCGGQAN